MKKEIIKKYDLKPTDKTIGSSFAYGLTVYSFCDDIFCAKMTPEGEPNPKPEIIMFFNDEGYCYVTETFLTDIKKEIAVLAIKDNLLKTNK